MVYLSDSENQQLISRMREMGSRTFSEYARWALLYPERSIVKIDTSGYEELMRELTRIGNNINQLARLSHQEQQVSSFTVEQLNESFEQLLLEIKVEFSASVKKVEEHYGRY
nr:plasmid mobilization relaxosome protein MobC [Streptococcus acidominimus]